MYINHNTKHVMTQTQAELKLFTFDEFIEWYPENSEVRYELHDGVIVEMPKPQGEHSDLAGFLIEELLITIREMGKLISCTCKDKP